MSLSIDFQGAARTVTGSMHLLRTAGGNVLLDCGLYQGRRKESFERNRHMPIDPHEVHCVVLSHAHIDHSGALPILPASGLPPSKPKRNIFIESVSLLLAEVCMALRAMALPR